MWFLPPRNSSHIYLATLVIREDQDPSLMMGDTLSLGKYCLAFWRLIAPSLWGSSSARMHYCHSEQVELCSQWQSIISQKSGTFNPKTILIYGNLTHNVKLLTVAVTSVRFCLLCTWSILQILQQLLYTFWDDRTIYVHSYVGAGS